MQVNVIFHPTATQIECHSNACATFANSNQCFFSRIPFFFGACLRGKLAGLKNNTVFFYQTHWWLWNAGNKKNLYIVATPTTLQLFFQVKGGHRVQKRHDVLMLFEFGSEINDFDTNLQSLGVRNRNILGVCFKSMSLKPMVRHLRTMQAGSFSQFEAKLTHASSRLQVVCVDDGLTRW